MTGTLTKQLSILCGILLLLSCQVVEGQDIPPLPENKDFVQDYAGLLESEDFVEIGRIQEVAFRDHDTPIIVVTIHRMSRYGWKGSIEDFAKEWFNTWDIGTLGREGGGSNKGILLLVSRYDRKARIELGGDWGRSWDSQCSKIMNREIVPSFKEGDYPTGIRNGVIALAEMAKNSPYAEAPAPGIADVIYDIGEQERLTPVSLFNGRWGILGVLAGVIFCILGILFPQYRKPLLIIGISLIVLVLLTWAFIAAFLLFSKSKGGGSSGGFPSGRGFSGGFSGGGGASGSW